VREQRFREGQHVRDRITHEATTIRHIYADGWLLVETSDGREQHVELRDMEPDPYYEGH
jgi:hypothetical protein